MKRTHAKPTPPSTTIQTAKPENKLVDRIRRRAYELYEQCGRADGHELDHWLQAEGEIVQKKARAAGA